MKWFKHFTDAHDSNDLTKVRIKYGAEGYAVYWYCLELIAGDLGTKDDITFELHHDAEVIGHNLKVDSARVEEIMRYMVHLNLFENANNRITCLKLAKYLDKRTTRNSKIHEIIDMAASETVRLQSETVRDKAGPFALDTDTDTDTDKTISSKSDDSDFSDFWNLYPRKEGRKKALTAWNHLNKTQKQKALQDITSRYNETEKRFIPLATTYIHGERWEDETENTPPKYGQGGI